MQKKNANVRRFIKLRQACRYYKLIFLLGFVRLGMLLMPAAVLSCTAEHAVQFTHLKGTLAWKQQDWNEAVLHFFEAEELAAALPGQDIKTYTDFALASSYLMQGEDAAAREKLHSIPETAPERVRAQSFYQQGIILFREKNYREAAACFQKSLELCGSDIDAKINYELSKKFCTRELEAQYGSPHTAAEETEPDNREDSIILDIIRKKEQSEWKKMQYEAEPAVNDY